MVKISSWSVKHIAGLPGKSCSPHPPLQYPLPGGGTRGGGDQGVGGGPGGWGGGPGGGVGGGAGGMYSEDK